MQASSSNVEELRNVLYLLTEIERWEASSLLSAEQAAVLRKEYEQRLASLRAKIDGDGNTASASTSAGADVEAEADAVKHPFQEDAQQLSKALQSDHSPSVHSAKADWLNDAQPPPPQLFHAPRNEWAAPRSPSASRPEQPRPFLEVLTDPHTLRLLLYTGAAMFVVGVVIWLRDVLYLKLQEPAVQAALLAISTIGITASGWYTILRTRQRLTGRALTLVGSMLVPVNFWFLVRSGLIENRGRAWMVCALCTLLYANTATLLRERLYAYLACAASVATLWALVYRSEREAFGLYALTLMGASLVFIHLSRWFAGKTDGGTPDGGRWTMDDEGASIHRPSSMVYGQSLWVAPLAHAGLAGAFASVILYMPLRLFPSPTLYEGAFRLRASTYDASVAMLLFAGFAYAMWFAGQNIYKKLRVPLYMASALALFWIEFLACDGLRLTPSTNLFILAATAFIVALASRVTREEELAVALHHATLFVSVLLAPISLSVLFNTGVATWKLSASFAFIAAAFAVLSAPRFCERVAQVALAFASAFFLTVAFLVTLASASIESYTLIAAACALWPFALYGCAQLALARQRETQIATAFVRTADGEALLVLLWASAASLILHYMFVVSRHENSRPELRSILPPVFCLLAGAIIYGSLRAWREHSVFGAALFSIAVLVCVATSGDTLKEFGALPVAWPVATFVIVAAFLMKEASERWMKQTTGDGQEAMNDKSASFNRSLAIVPRLMDCAVSLCALLWFALALIRMEQGGKSAALVLFLALAYWVERAASSKAPSVVYLAAIHACAFLIALLVALNVEPRWFAFLFALTLFPVFFAVKLYAQAREAVWLASPLGRSAAAVAAISFIAAALQALPILEAGNRLLLAPCLTMTVVSIMSLAASLLSEGRARVRYFRAGLYVGVAAFWLACLRAGYEPAADVEIYTTPVAIVLLIVSYVSVRREWKDYSSDARALFWLGSLLLCAPLLLRALEYRLLMDVPAPWRDIGVLCAALALLLFGVLGRLRAPVIVGLSTLIIELAALVFTSVDWLQVPLKYYLLTVGALLALVGWLFEYRREQLISLRQRFNARRAHARERFGEWR